MSLTFEGVSYVDVPAPYFGEGISIRVNRRTIKHYVKRSQLGRVIDEMKLDQDDFVAHVVAAGLMSVCTLPETGEFAFKDKQITDLVNLLPADLYMEITAAHYKMNPGEFESVTDSPTLSSKKKKS